MDKKIIPLKFESINDNIYSGFWSRLGANLLDMLISTPFILLLTYINSLSLHIYFFTLIPNLVFLFWYHIYMPKRYGGTPGKIIAGIKIVKLDSSFIGWKESFLRHSVFLTLSIISIAMTVISILRADHEIYSNLPRLERIGYLSSLSPGTNLISALSNIWIWSEVVVLLINKRKRAIHDYIAGTVIIKTKYVKDIQEIMNGTTKPNLPGSSA